MSQSCHDSDLGINFLTEISPHEVSWDQHRSDAESVKIIYNYAVEFSQYAERINGCSGILKFGVNPDQGKLVLKQAFFAVSVIVLCVSGADLYFEGGYVSAIAKYSGTLSNSSLGISNPHRKNPPVTELRDTLKHMNDSWQRLIQTKRFKSGVAGFLRTTEVTRGNDADMMAHPSFSCLVVSQTELFQRTGIYKTR